MRESRFLPLAFVALCSAAAVASSPPSTVETRLPRSWQPFPARDEGPAWGLSPELLGGLRDQARRFEGLAGRLTCTETAVLWRDGSSGASARELGAADYRIRTDLGEERSRGGKRTGSGAFDKHAQPPPFAWLSLFSERNRRSFLYRQLDESVDGFDRIATIQFRGTEPFDDGLTIRQWEGIAVVDVDDHTLLEVMAEPRGQSDLLQARLNKRNKKLALRIGPGGPTLRAARRVRVRRTTVMFQGEPGSPRLPSLMRSEVRIVDDDWAHRRNQLLVRRFEEWTLDGNRF